MGGGGMSIQCPVECVGVGCPQPDFIERNGAFVLTVVGALSACFGLCLTYMLKSRCKKIMCCGVGVERDVLAIDASNADVNLSEASVKPS
jgi:hypothetical protein